MALQAEREGHLGIGHGRGGGGMLGSMGRIPRDKGRRWSAGGELVLERAAGAAPVALCGWVVGQNA